MNLPDKFLRCISIAIAFSEHITKLNPWMPPLGYFGFGIFAYHMYITEDEVFKHGAYSFLVWSIIAVFILVVVTTVCNHFTSFTDNEEEEDSP